MMGSEKAESEKLGCLKAGRLGSEKLKAGGEKARGSKLNREITEDNHENTKVRKSNKKLSRAEAPQLNSPARGVNSTGQAGNTEKLGCLGSRSKECLDLLLCELCLPC
jgi:hypothetical protein